MKNDIKFKSKTGIFVLGKEPKPKKVTFGYLWEKENPYRNIKIQPLLNKSFNKNKLKFLYTDIMRDYIWPWYHFLTCKTHRQIRKNWLISCGHYNPFYILTPRLFNRQIKNIIDNKL